jgi:peptidoglycan/LPS O-acetylase OafA/YrhL
MSTDESRIHEIDSLRGIAILSVVIFHLVVFPLTTLLTEIGVREVLTLLAFGVDLFFVISGFLIGNILLKIDGFSGIKAFYIRRILRIWPLYYMLLILVYLCLPDKRLFSSAPYWSFFLFTFNFWESTGKGIHQALGPLWSIAVEEQFYVLGPLVFSMLSRRRITFLLAACVVLSPILRLILFYKTAIDTWRFTPTRIDGIYIGLLLAIFLSSRSNLLFVEKRIKYFKYAGLFLLTSLIPAIIFFPEYLWASLGQSLVVLAFGCILLVVQVQNFSGYSIRFLNWGILRYLGLRCYSIYLFHTFLRF